MAIAALVVSLIAVAIATISLVFTWRSDQREEDEATRSVRREAREEVEAAAKRQGRPIVVSRGGNGGALAPAVRHEYEVRNGGYATITELHLWIEDGNGKTVSTPAGGHVSIGPGDPPIFTGVSVSQPLPAEQTLMVTWRDADGEHTESTGINPPLHM